MAIRFALHRSQPDLATTINNYKFEPMKTRKIDFPKLYIVLFSCLLICVQYAKLKIGRQGIDFAIFSQAANNFAQGWGLVCSLIDYKEQHFLTHHFSPYLYLVGYLSRLAGDAPSNLIFLHALAIFFVLAGILTIVRASGATDLAALSALMLFTLLPATRNALFWEVRDEIYALPFLVWAVVFFADDKYLKSLWCLLATLLFKETMLIAVAFVSLTIIINLALKGRLFSGLSAAFACLVVVCLSGFFLYTQILPFRYFIPTFDGFTRISSLQELLIPATLHQKFWWAVDSFAPFLPFFAVGILSSRKVKPHCGIVCFLRTLFVLLLPAIPFVAVILISNFPMMYQSNLYYSVVPVSLTFVALLLALKKCAPASLCFPVSMAAIFIALAIGPYDDIFSDLKTAWREEPYAAKLTHLIKPTDHLILGDFDAPLFLQMRNLTRIFHARKNILPFDYVIIRKDRPEKLSPYYNGWSKVCYEDDRYQVLCAYPTAKNRVHP